MKLSKLICGASIVLASLGIAGTASANSFTPTPSCDGFKLEIPKTEDGTRVLVFRNGAIVADVTNDTFGRPVSITVPSPDPTVPQRWAVRITGYNGTLTWYGTQQACVVPTTTTTTTTTMPAPTTTVSTETTVPPTSTTVFVDVDIPPVATTVITTPRPTTTTVPTVWTLPETGASSLTTTTAWIALAVCATAVFLLLATRRK